MPFQFLNWNITFLIFILDHPIPLPLVALDVLLFYLSLFFYEKIHFTKKIIYFP